MENDDWKDFVEEHYKYHGDEEPLSSHAVLGEGFDIEIIGDSYE